MQSLANDLTPVFDLPTDQYPTTQDLEAAINLNANFTGEVVHPVPTTSPIFEFTAPPINFVPHVPPGAQPTSSDIYSLDSGVNITQQLFHSIRQMTETINSLQQEVNTLRGDLSAIKAQKTVSYSVFVSPG